MHRGMAAGAQRRQPVGVVVAGPAMVDDDPAWGGADAAAVAVAGQDDLPLSAEAAAGPAAAFITGGAEAGDRGEMAAAGAEPGPVQRATVRGGVLGARWVHFGDSVP